MGVWKSDHTVIAVKGMQLLSDLAGKKPLVISRAVAGSAYTTPSELENLTDITHQQLNMKFSDVAEKDKKTKYFYRSPNMQPLLHLRQNKKMTYLSVNA